MASRTFTGSSSIMGKGNKGRLAVVKGLSEKDGPFSLTIILLSVYNYGISMGRYVLEFEIRSKMTDTGRLLTLI